MTTYLRLYISTYHWSSCEVESVASCPGVGIAAGIASGEGGEVASWVSGLPEAVPWPAPAACTLRFSAAAAAAADGSQDGEAARGWLPAFHCWHIGEAAVHSDVGPSWVDEESSCCYSQDKAVAWI